MKNYQPINSKIYDKNYFLNQCTGFEQFKKTFGKKLNARLERVLEVADLKADLKVLDIGCGRGELVLHAVKKGCDVVAVDYSLDAIRLTKSVVNTLSKAARKRVKIYKLDAKKLNFSKGTFDVILMADFVEHLHDWELKIVFNKCALMLKKGGKLVIHTAPNKWYINYTYPLLRLFFRMKGKDLGSVRNHYPDFHEHVNENSPLQLFNSLKSKFKVKVWSENMNHATIINNVPILNNFAVSIFAVAYKK